MKALVSAFNQEKALVGAFFVITNLQMDLRFKLYYQEAAEAASDVAGGYLAPADAEYEEYEEQAAYGGAPTYSGRL